MEQQKVIGTDFLVGIVVFDGAKLSVVADSEISFHIDKYMDFVSQIMKFVDYKNIVGCYVKTNTGFVSHYYLTEGLTILMTHVFGSKVQCIRECGSRYIVAHLTGPTREGSTREDSTREDSTSGTTQSVLTCLNNVIGNIPTDQQFAALEKINQIIG